MTQTSAPFDAGAGAAVTEATWQKMSRSWLATGVLTARLNQLLVSADGSALSVSVASGQAQVEGFFYENDSALALTIATANATNPRLDTVVLRLDRTANTAVLAIVTGTPAASPVAPALSATDTLFELPLANVTVPAAAGVIVAGNVADRRVLVRNLTEAAEVWQRIGEVALTSAGSAAFTSIPQTFRHLRLEIAAWSTRVATDDQLLLRINGDVTANYDYETLTATGTAVTAAEALGATFIEVGVLPGASSPTGSAGVVSVDIPNYSTGSFNKAALARSGSRTTAATGGVGTRTHHGSRRNAAAVTQLNLLAGNGSLGAGSVVTLYGLKGA